ncbi:hypothetical protein [Sphingomonas sp. PWP1-2]|uniref:hypothetical protein n=1 Tax=Sphingomonas sp. PWP1-2 TaxID=2804558 RepID=UPI003CF12129
MDDVLFIAWAEAIVEFVDERYGRAAAWMAALAMLGVFVAVIAGLIWWIAC